MKLQRSYLVRKVEVYEGEFPSDLPIEDGEWLSWEHDQYACDNWKLISEDTELLDDDQLDYRIVEEKEIG